MDKCILDKNLFVDDNAVGIYSEKSAKRGGGSPYDELSMRR